MRETVQAEQRHALHLLMGIPAGVCYLRGPGMVYELANSRYLALTGSRPLLGKPLREALPEITAQGFVDILDEVYRSATVYSAADVLVLLQEGENGPLREKWLDFVYQPMCSPAGNVEGILVLVVEVTEKMLERRKVEQLNAERTALQQELIRTQQAALRELATPLVPLADGVIAMPLVGAIDTERAAQIMETLLDGVTAQSARVALLDVTGVRTVDTQVAGALIRTARAAQLLGAEVVLTGLSPVVSRTLVSLGVDFSTITTLRSLQMGLAYALRKTPETTDDPAPHPRRHRGRL
ncbi:STAS domain-containing protein [Chondromyces apiculatus]|uniref:STAS domain-containing protein n=1 Tax=Chondromyces apiculatus TaxID=51 RepID=UPI001E3F8D3C|nr:STAS domain-containing protein [Chondromyces apiculatus]